MVKFRPVPTALFALVLPLMGVHATAGAIVIPGLVLPADAVRVPSTAGNTAAVRALGSVISSFSCSKVETWTLKGRDAGSVLEDIALHPKNQHLSFRAFPFAGLDDLGSVQSVIIEGSKGDYRAALWTYRGKLTLNLCV